jgi:hypothetical protein
MNEIRKDFIDRIWSATPFLDVVEHSDAQRTEDKILDLIIDRVRSDPRMPQKTFHEWAVALGALRQESEAIVDRLCDDRVNLRDTVEAIIDEI